MRGLVRPILSLAVCLLCPLALALPNGLGKLPAMGWSASNLFYYNGHALLNRSRVLEVAHALKSSGLQAHGYKYVLMDSGWQEVTLTNYASDRNKTIYVLVSD